MTEAPDLLLTFIQKEGQLCAPHTHPASPKYPFPGPTEQLVLKAIFGEPKLDHTHLLDTPLLQACAGHHYE